MQTTTSPSVQVDKENRQPGCLMLLMATDEPEGYEFLQRCSYRIRLTCGTKTMDVWICTRGWYGQTENPLPERLRLRNNLNDPISNRFPAERTTPDTSISGISPVGLSYERCCIVLKGTSKSTRNREGVGESTEMTFSGGLPWTKEEDLMLINMRDGGGSFAEIAGSLGRDEFQVLCRYTDLVPLPSSGPKPRYFVATIFWLRRDDSSGVGSGQWRICGKQTIHCEL
jgi:hypothetical protein